MNVLITGSSGFISSHFCNYFRDQEINFFGIDINPSDNTNLITDIRKKIDFTKIPSNIDLIINLAAVHREPGHDSKEYFETNILGAENVCELAEKVNCNSIIFTSSISPYGSSDNIKDEYVIPSPISPYGASKLVAEKIHIAWQNRDLNRRVLTIVRPGVVFGKGEMGNMSRLVKLVHKNFFFYMSNKDTPKAGIYVKELIHQIMWVHKNQIKNNFSKTTLFNSTMWPNPTIYDYVSSVKVVSKIKRFIPNIPFAILLIFAYFFEIIFKCFAISNPFSPVRIRKLVRPNAIKPSFLIKNKYKQIYTLETAFADWKGSDYDIWPK